MFPETPIPSEILTWDDVDKAIDHLIPQFNTEYDAIVMITRGGLIPGGILCEIMDIQNVHTAAVHFAETPNQNMAWPTFMQFPVGTLVRGKRLLVVDDIWATGTNMIAVKGRLEMSGALVETAVLHFRPTSNKFPDVGPDYYSAITNRFIIYPWTPSTGISNNYLKPPTYDPSQLD